MSHNLFPVDWVEGAQVSVAYKVPRKALQRYVIVCSVSQHCCYPPKAWDSIARRLLRAATVAEDAGDGDLLREYARIAFGEAETALRTAYHASVQAALFGDGAFT